MEDTKKYIERRIEAAICILMAEKCPDFQWLRGLPRWPDMVPEWQNYGTEGSVAKLERSAQIISTRKQRELADEAMGWITHAAKVLDRQLKPVQYILQMHNHPLKNYGWRQIAQAIRVELGIRNGYSYEACRAIYDQGIDEIEKLLTRS